MRSPRLCTHVRLPQTFMSSSTTGPGGSSFSSASVGMMVRSTVYSHAEEEKCRALLPDATRVPDEAGLWESCLQLSSPLVPRAPRTPLFSCPAASEDSADGTATSPPHSYPPAVVMLQRTGITASAPPPAASPAETELPATSGAPHIGERQVHRTAPATEMTEPPGRPAAGEGPSSEPHSLMNVSQTKPLLLSAGGGDHASFHGRLCGW